MKLFADESVDRHVVIKLRESGYEIPYVAEMEPGISDETVLEKANQIPAILLTEDKDFGELVYRQQLIHEGVVLIRLVGISSEKKAELVLNVINEHGRELKKVFCVISPGIVRIRK